MAEKKKGAARLYGNSPRIDDAMPGGDTNASGDEAGAAEAAEATAGAPETQGTMNKGGNTKGAVMAGTDHIPTHHHQHATERHELHGRHMAEHHEMHHRHEREHLLRVMGHHHEAHEEMHHRHEEEKRKLHTRHEKERREMHDRHEEEGSSGPTAGIRDRDEGKRGTEPKK